MKEIQTGLYRDIAGLEAVMSDRHLTPDAKIKGSKLHVALLKDKTVGTSEAIVIHGLVDAMGTAISPWHVSLTMKTPGIIQLSSASTRSTSALWYDATNVYLVADAANRVCDLLVYG
jgi:hypothetical protein